MALVEQPIPQPLDVRLEDVGALRIARDDSTAIDHHPDRGLVQSVFAHRRGESRHLLAAILRPRRAKKRTTLFSVADQPVLPRQSIVLSTGCSVLAARASITSWVHCCRG
jgi:hypothetical protein